jgi:NAD(P)-dependent dehydrogenase (short-subunit alcohol dehydrogenase family)
MRPERHPAAGIADDRITPDDIAGVVTFVGSPLASAINGAALRADGGVVRSIA